MFLRLVAKRSKEPSIFRMPHSVTEHPIYREDASGEILEEIVTQATAGERSTTMKARSRFEA